MKKLIIILVIIFSLVVVIQVTACPWPPPFPSPTPRPTPIIPTPVLPTTAPTQAPPPTMAPTLGPAPTMPPQPTSAPSMTPGTVLPIRITQPPKVECDNDTGQSVYELVMFNTDVLHYGFWSGNSKTGICKIESDSFPNGNLIAQFCGCQMPGFVWRTDAYKVWHIMTNCTGSQHLEMDGMIGEPYGGWNFGNYCPSTGCK